MATLKGVALKGDVMNIKEEILAQMDSALRPEFDKAIDNTIEGAFKEDVKTLGFMVANSIKCQWEVMKPHLFYAYCLGVKAQEARTQAVPEWINVNDKLPPANILVLGMSQTPRNIFNIYNVMALDEFEEADVTHWMPLPDAPQEPANADTNS